MKRIITTLIGVVDDFATTQLKAYYVGHVDVNVQKLIETADLQVDADLIFQFPEWVVPLCSVAAAAFAAVKGLRSLVGLFRSKNKGDGK